MRYWIYFLSFLLAFLKYAVAAPPQGRLNEQFPAAQSESKKVIIQLFEW